MDLAAQLASIRQRIATACERANRSPDEVCLLPVTKGHPPETVEAAAELGLNVFGENKVQEAKAKIPRCPGHLQWHMIGHLQTNKCRDAVHWFAMIQSVDSLKLAVDLDKHAAKAAKTVPVLLEVNVAGEVSKHGFAPDQLLAELKSVNALAALEVHGLMTLAPWTPEPEKLRPLFARMRELRDQCQQILGAPLPHLSMGMSNDFQIAIEEGSTMVRLGTELFGPRQRPK